MDQIPYGNPDFTSVSISSVRASMAIMRVPLLELLCKLPMRWISVLIYLLLGVCGHLCPCPIVPGIKCFCFLRSRLQ
jgi:hypothetical protein